ncbi:MAG: transcriptional regulator [Opitutus sp.]|nr:transcriptional regulator [Opitutus sp.]
MSSRSSSPRRVKEADGPEGDLAASVLRDVANGPADRPLPTTREFGRRHGVASATAYRVLQKLTKDGRIWQHPTSGRFYPATARVLLDRPKPVACVIRRLELDSEQYREMLEGISGGCGALRRSMLLWHDESLVNHPEPHEFPVFASLPAQRAILKDFLDRHGEAAGGFILDHVWSDDALRAFRGRLKPAVMLFRSCSLDDFSSVRADFHSGALKALAHLLGRGFERIVPIQPFAGDPAVSEFMAALEKAVDEAGCRNRLAPIVPASTDRERADLVAQLRRETRRTALVCPEDNVAAYLTTSAREAGIDCPTRLGILSVMGTDVATRSGISCLRYDFRAMGRLAVDALGSQPVRHVLEPRLVPGSTT